MNKQEFSDAVAQILDEADLSEAGRAAFHTLELTVLDDIEFLKEVQLTAAGISPIKAGKLMRKLAELAINNGANPPAEMDQRKSKGADDTGNLADAVYQAQMRVISDTRPLYDWTNEELLTELKRQAEQGTVDEELMATVGDPKRFELVAINRKQAGDKLYYMAQSAAHIDVERTLKVLHELMFESVVYDKPWDNEYFYVRPDTRLIENAKRVRMNPFASKPQGIASNSWLAGLDDDELAFVFWLVRGCKLSDEIQVRGIRKDAESEYRSEWNDLVRNDPREKERMFGEMYLIRGAGMTLTNSSSLRAAIDWDAKYFIPQGLGIRDMGSKVRPILESLLGHTSKEWVTFIHSAVKPYVQNVNRIPSLHVDYNAGSQGLFITTLTNCMFNNNSMGAYNSPLLTVVILRALYEMPNISPDHQTVIEELLLSWKK
jgi:hypothetical protein